MTTDKELYEKCDEIATYLDFNEILRIFTTDNVREQSEILCALADYDIDLSKRADITDLIKTIMAITESHALAFYSAYCLGICAPEVAAKYKVRGPLSNKAKLIAGGLKKAGIQ